ncbi:hypothetical protein BP6252_01998 [Coleophoma cylindrospora]|uniref:RRM domain-containing protein n=1 Tax=Coleophoma cylindrospora TaxID=1849047 RepID=A0A3D8SF78_9HELO|nr:hypothetical protein BP6252_01998 [Coleophoma cylindrospora]
MNRQLFRRSVFRAVSSPSIVITKSRSIQSSTPFALRSRVQAPVISSVFRRAYANSSDVDTAEKEHKSVESAVDAAESAPVYAFGNTESRERTSAPRAHGFTATPRRILAPGPSIYIGNLLFDVTDADLSREFQKFGEIKKAAVATDARGLSKGFGYVDFETQEQAAAAIEAMDETVFEGRRIMVNYVARSARPSTQNPPSKTLFIGNLAFEMSDADLNKLFRDIRNVIDVRVAIDRRTGQPRGFAHADFVDVESAVKGLEQLQGKEIYGRALRCDYSAPSKNRAAPTS